MLVVLFSSGAVAILAWVWKVKRRNPFTCKPLDGVEMKMKTPTGNKVAPEFGAVIGGGGGEHGGCRCDGGVLVDWDSSTWILVLTQLCGIRGCRVIYGRAGVSP